MTISAICCWQISSTSVAVSGLGLLLSPNAKSMLWRRSRKGVISETSTLPFWPRNWRVDNFKLRWDMRHASKWEARYFSGHKVCCISQILIWYDWIFIDKNMRYIKFSCLIISQSFKLPLLANQTGIRYAFAYLQLLRHHISSSFLRYLTFFNHFSSEILVSPMSCLHFWDMTWVRQVSKISA